MSVIQHMGRIIADFGSFDLPSPTPRRLTLPSLPGKVDVVLGMRRTGKTWYLFQKIAELESVGVPRARILYFNFEDERLRPLVADHLDILHGAFYERNPESVGQECWFFLDEVQEVPGWELFVRRLVDQQPATGLRVVLSGSSARLLGREIATSLRGRSLVSELLPFSFGEYLRHRHVDPPDRWPADLTQRSLLAHHLGQYLQVGGFPEVQSLDVQLRTKVLQNYVGDVLFRDVVERHGVTNVAALRYLVRWLVRAPACAFSVNRFFNDLKSQGFKVSKDTLHEYLAFLEDAYLIYTITIHDRSERGRMVNPRKVYLADPALAGAYSYEAGGNTGHSLENLVFLELRRRGYEVSYVVTRSGYEVDFYATRSAGPPLLVQVCSELSDPGVQIRETRALEAGMQETGVPEGVIVTMREEGEVRAGPGVIRWVPAWRWLIEE